MKHSVIMYYNWQPTKRGVYQIYVRFPNLVKVVLSTFIAGKDPEYAIIKPRVSGSHRFPNRMRTHNKKSDLKTIQSIGIKCSCLLRNLIILKPSFSSSK